MSSYQTHSAPASYHRETAEGVGPTREMFACVQALRSAAELLNEVAVTLIAPGSDGIPVDPSAIPVCRFRSPDEAVTAALDLIAKAKTHGGHITFPPPPGRVINL